MFLLHLHEACERNGGDVLWLFERRGGDAFLVDFGGGVGDDVFAVPHVVGEGKSLELSEIGGVVAGDAQVGGIPCDELDVDVVLGNHVADHLEAFVTEDGPFTGHGLDLLLVATHGEGRELELTDLLTTGNDEDGRLIPVGERLEERLVANAGDFRDLELRLNVLDGFGVGVVHVEFEIGVEVLKPCGSALAVRDATDFADVGDDTVEVGDVLLPVLRRGCKDRDAEQEGKSDKEESVHVRNGMVRKRRGWRAVVRNP